jgi:hypothetical protein
VENLWLDSDESSGSLKCWEFLDQLIDSLSSRRTQFLGCNHATHSNAERTIVLMMSLNWKGKK